MPMFDKLQGLSEGQYYYYSKYYEGLFGSSASLMSFANQDRAELQNTLDEIQKSLDNKYDS